MVGLKRTPDSEPGLRGSVVCGLQIELDGKPKRGGGNINPYLSLSPFGKAIRGKQPRSKPDSGNPTVRDCRGACGNVMQDLIAICHESGNRGNSWKLLI